ncbi:MAG: helix-turn-helix transcriptional regulator [Ruminococcaceae bacterium]|nr:helix-turn-helix transcriptional regulator [Oscillospiraceae bacterium]
MTIGEKIKYLRRKNDVTQEKLAEYLNITYQSISKWENNNALPDISLVVPIANFFGVTLDELFDRDGDLQTAEIEDYMSKDYDLAHISSAEAVSERIAMWRQAVEKYPKDFRCLMHLARALHTSLHWWQHAAFQKSYNDNAREVIRICERILGDCTDNGIRQSAVQTLVYTYSFSYLEVANEEKAVEYANMANSIYTCRESLLQNAYFTEEGKKKGLQHKHYYALTLMDKLCGNLIYRQYATTEEYIFALETALKLWKTLIYDDNFLFENVRVGYICSQLAQNYAVLGDRDNTLLYLEMGYKYVKAFEELPTTDGVYYTSVFVCEAEGAKHPFDTCMDSFTADLKKSCFDFVREDPSFVQLQAKVTE